MMKKFEGMQIVSMVYLFWLWKSTSMSSQNKTRHKL